MGALLCISQAMRPEIFLSSHGPLLAARHAERATRRACMATLRVAWHAPAWAGAVAGFLRYNFNTASIFLGDCGSLLLSIAGELLFYGWWDWRFLALMICSTTVDFLIAQKISANNGDTNRKKWLIFSLILNFSTLGVFKYFNFFADSVSAALNTLGVPNIPLPLLRIL